MFCNMYVANNSSILQYCHGMSIEGVLVFYRTTEYANSWEGGGLNGEAKAQVLVVTPPPLFFLKVGRKRGGGVTAGQYGTRLQHAYMCMNCRPQTDSSVRGGGGEGGGGPVLDVK